MYEVKPPDSHAEKNHTEVALVSVEQPERGTRVYAEGHSSNYAGQNHRVLFQRVPQCGRAEDAQCSTRQAERRLHIRRDERADRGEEGCSFTVWVLLLVEDGTAGDEYEEKTN